MPETDLDFFLGTEAESAAEPSGARESNDSTAVVAAKAAEESRIAAIDDVIGVLLPTEEKAAAETPDEKNKEEAEAEEPPARQPVIHESRLLHLASVHGIGPDEAAEYPNARELLKEIHYREMQYRRSEAPPPIKAGGPPPDDMALPEIKLDEDTDPSIKAAVTTLADYTKKLKAWADVKIAAQEEVIEGLRAGQEQAASVQARNAETKIAQLFDDKAASWGPEFKELLGTPTDTWRKPGTKEHAELVKLHGKTRQLAAGFATLEGRDPTSEEIGGFLEEARYALWPDKIKVALRNEISNGVKKQRGGVALRPGKARNEAPPEQGDAAARDAIGDFMAEHGLDPWARRKAV